MTFWTMIAAVAMLMWAISLAIGLAWINSPAPARARTDQLRSRPQGVPQI